MYNIILYHVCMLHGSGCLGMARCLSVVIIIDVIMVVIFIDLYSQNEKNSLWA